MKYSLEQQEIIRKGKIYLKAMRTLNREKMELIEEYYDEPSPSSPTFHEIKKVSKSQVNHFNNYAMKRDVILRRIHAFNNVIDEFFLKTFLVSAKYRRIIKVYIQAKSYLEMLDELDDKYFISPSTYKRELPEICLALSKYIDYDQIPNLDIINVEIINL